MNLIDLLFYKLKGGAGSGNFGHGGRKGKRGGSNSGGGMGSGAKIPKFTKSQYRKMNIDRVSNILKKINYKLGKGSFDLKTQTSSYQITSPDGSTSKMNTDKIYNLLSEHFE